MTSTDPWSELHQEIVKWATDSGWEPREARKQIQQRLARLADQGLCHPSASSWIFEVQGHIQVSNNADATSARGGPAIGLKGFPTETVLAVSIIFKGVGSHHELRDYSISVERPGGNTPWNLRIELDPKRMGVGPCSHPSLHGHFVQTCLPEARFPLPPLQPWDALDWLLATIDTNLEPVPWPKTSGN